MRQVTALCVFLMLTPCVCAQDGRPPSVIVIMADQLRADVIGEWTPNILALKRDGVSFSNAYCASPICVPSRGSFFTGLYPNHTGSLINGWEDEDASFSRVKAGLPNLYTVLGPEFDSWHVGKQHFFTEDTVERNGSPVRWITQTDYNSALKKKAIARPGGPEFKAMIPETVSGTRTHTRAYSIPAVGLYEGGLDNFTDHFFGNESVDAIRHRDKNKPLFLSVMFLAPHPPFDVPDPYYSLVDPAKVKLPENVGKWYPGQSPLQLYNLTGFLGTRYAREAWKEPWAKYLGLVRLLDDEVGRIIRALKEEGLYEQSVIVFTADHGEMLGSHSLWQKMCMYEESAHVPLTIKFPETLHIPKREVDATVSLVDVFPTLLELTRTSVPGPLDGRSLLPLARSGSQQQRPVFIQYDGNGSLGNFQRCVVSDGYKLIVDLFKDEVFLELYHVREDPQEKKNLAFEKGFREKTLSLIALLRGHMRRTGDRLTLDKNIYDTFLEHYQTIIKK